MDRTESVSLLRWPYEAIADLGGRLGQAVASLGDITVFSLRTWGWMLRRRPARGTLTTSFYLIGVQSLPVVALTGLFIGMVLSVHTFAQFRLLGLQSWVGGVINRALIRELGPVLAATMLAGRVGSAIAAELGTMKITEQIDALATMGTNPVHFLVVPRFLACIILIPSLTVMADFMGLAGGYCFCTGLLQVDPHHYWEHAQHFVNGFDLAIGLLKSLFFGAVIGLISCHQGFQSEGGAEGVGRAATKAFVYSFVAILILDLMLGITLDTAARALGAALEARS